MIKRLIPISLTVIFCVGIALSDTNTKCNLQPLSLNDSICDTDSTDNIIDNDSIACVNDSLRYNTLTDEDYQKVADELGIEVAAMKAVVSIEAGNGLKGFCAPGVPLINFDKSVYNSLSNKIKSTKKADPNSKIPEGIESAYSRKEWQQLINARKNNEERANMATFWGMFQIGGFNYKLCGCESVDEFIQKMSHSEYMQLQLFAAFITNTNIVKYLREKNWTKFARKYNGPGYAKRGYHTKMAKAYNKFKNQK